MISLKRKPPRVAGYFDGVANALDSAESAWMNQPALPSSPAPSPSVPAAVPRPAAAPLPSPPLTTETHDAFGPSAATVWANMPIWGKAAIGFIVVVGGLSVIGGMKKS